MDEMMKNIKKEKADPKPEAKAEKADPDEL